MTKEKNRNTTIVLLRGINVGGHKKVPMAELRELCTTLGWHNVKTYIQSGNVVCESGNASDSMERDLEAAIMERWDFEVTVVARDANAWNGLVRANPFVTQSKEHPNLVMVALAKFAISSDATSLLAERATRGEEIAQVGESVWIHFPNGSGRSKITPNALDRALGSPVTMRNVRTVHKLSELAELEV